jgi:hypothetical protein
LYCNLNDHTGYHNISMHMVGVWNKNEENENEYIQGYPAEPIPG